jgi:hypothetical protein
MSQDTNTPHLLDVIRETYSNFIPSICSSLREDVGDHDYPDTYVKEVQDAALYLEHGEGDPPHISDELAQDLAEMVGMS